MSSNRIVRVLPGATALAATALAGLLGVANAAAAEAAADDLFDLPLDALEQLVVTAERRSVDPQDLAVSLVAFSAQALERFGVDDTQGLQLVTPGLTFNNTGTSAQPYLRGVGTRFAFAGVEPSVSTYLDDRYIARAQATLFEFADVERVEVLKGPQGTLYGRNATGGAIRIITRDVGDELAGRIMAGLGDYRRRTLSATVNVPFTDAAGGRFTLLSRQRDGYADNLVADGVSELDDQDYLALRAKLRWDISPRTTARLSLQYTDQHDNLGNDLVDLSPPGLNAGIAGGGISGRKVDEVATAIDGRIDSRDLSVSARLEIGFDAYDLVSVTTFDDFKQNSNSDADGTSAAVVDAFDVPQEARAFSQEWHVVSTGDGRWQWLAGVYLFFEDTDFEILLDTGLPTVVSQGDQNAATSAGAVFGQVSYEFADTWSATLGARWSYERKQVSVDASSFTPVTTAPSPFHDEHDWVEVTPRLTVERRFDAGMAYFSYARGFKSGGYNYTASRPTSRVLDPEILDMVELGIKVGVFADRLRLAGSLYFYDYDDLQVTRSTDLDGTIAVLTDNAASARVMGFDVDATFKVRDGLTLVGGANVLDTEYDDYHANANVFNAALPNAATTGMSTVPFDATGEDLLRASDWSAFVSIEQVFTLGSARVPVTLTYSYRDDYLFDFIADPSTQSLRQRGYGLLNARASYVFAGDQLVVALWANNLTDEDDYYADIVANPAGIRASHGDPRTWGIDLSYRF